MHESTTTETRHGIYYVGIASETVAPAPSPSHTMFVDGTEYDADAVRAQEETITRLRDRHAQVAKNLHDQAMAFRSAIAELVDDGDLDKAKANEVLEALTLDPLATHYRATVTVEFEVAFDSTMDESAVADALTDSTFDMDTYSSEIEDFAINGANVGDVNVEVDE